MLHIKKHSFDHEIKLYNLADVHRGHELCDSDFFHRIIDDIRTDPHAFWVSTGDLGEIALKNSKGNVYESKSPQWELETLVEELTPIASKCLGVVFSNHPKRIQDVSGLEFDKILCDRLGIDYLGKTGYLALKVGNGTYFAILHHGSGGGTTGNKVNRAKQLSIQRPGADLYLTGHVHTCIDFPIFQKYIDRKRLTVVKVNSRHQIGGHFIRYDDSYADMMMLEESPVACGVTYLGFCKTGRNSDKSIRCETIFP